VVIGAARDASPNRFTTNHSVSLPQSVVQFLTAIAADPRIERIAIFGSRAVGDNDERADCDVALYAPELTRAQFARLRVNASESRSLYWISLVHFEHTPELLQERIVNQGITIYERTQTSRQSRESRTCK
jgi:uncharacterized protein